MSEQLETPTPTLFALRSENYDESEQAGVEQILNMIMTLKQQINLRKLAGHDSSNY